MRQNHEGSTGYKLAIQPGVHVDVEFDDFHNAKLLLRWMIDNDIESLRHLSGGQGRYSAFHTAEDAALIVQQVGVIISAPPVPDRSATTTADRAIIPPPDMCGVYYGKGGGEGGKCIRPWNHATVETDGVGHSDTLFEASEWPT